MSIQKLNRHTQSISSYGIGLPPHPCTKETQTTTHKSQHMPLGRKTQYEYKKWQIEKFVGNAARSPTPIPPAHYIGERCAVRGAETVYHIQLDVQLSSVPPMK